MRPLSRARRLPIVTGLTNRYASDRKGRAIPDMNSTTKKAAVAGAVLALALLAGSAVALWSATGTGAGNAKAITAQSVTVTAATGTADLYPGYTQGDVYFTLTNPNPYPITFTSMTPGTITSSNAGACAASNVSVVSASGLSLTVGANATSGVQSIADVVSMASGAGDGCQGITFTVALTLTGSQS